MPTCHPLSADNDPEKLVTCPYESAHRVSMKRIQFHVTKCRKNYPNSKKEVCPFNATHMINEQEFQFHLETCPNKGIIDSFKYSTSKSDHAIELPPIPVIPPSEENWDNEHCGTYDPTIRLAQEPLIYTLIGGTKSERKKSRHEQREKFRTLGESASTNKVVPKPKERKLLDDQPLRQPKTVPKSLMHSTVNSESLNLSSKSGVSDTSVPLRRPKTIPMSFLNRSVQSASLNQSFTSGTSNGEKTSNLKGLSDVIGVLNDGISDLRLEPSKENIPGLSQNGDDFIVFKSKGRGKRIN